MLLENPSRKLLHSLQGLGLVVSGDVTRQNDESVAAGNVISVTPAAGTEVVPGTEVSLVVSLGSTQQNQSAYLITAD